MKTKKKKITNTNPSTQVRQVWRLYKKGEGNDTKWYVRFWLDWSTYEVKSFEQRLVNKKGEYFMPLMCIRVKDETVLNKIRQVVLV